MLHMELNTRRHSENVPLGNLIRHTRHLENAKRDQAHDEAN